MRPYQESTGTNPKHVQWGGDRYDDAQAFDVPAGATATVSMRGKGALLESTDDGESFHVARDTAGRLIQTDTAIGGVHLSQSKFARLIKPDVAHGVPLLCEMTVQPVAA